MSNISTKTRVAVDEELLTLKNVRMVVFLPEDHFHAGIVLQELARIPDTEILAVTTPKLTKVHGGRKRFRDVIRESGLRYVLSMGLMKLWYDQRAAFERHRRVPIRDRRFLPVLEAIEALGCQHARFASVKDLACLERVGVFAPHLIFSVFFNQIVPNELIELAGAPPGSGAYNVHPSPLPAYRGISPAFWTLSDGHPHSGVTIHELTPVIDQGQYVAREEFDISERDTVFSVYRRSATLAGELAAEIVERARRGLMPSTIERNKVGESYRSTITRDAVKSFRGRGRKFFRLAE